MTPVTRHPRALLERIFQGAIAAVAPGPAVQRAVAGLPIGGSPWLRILAMGKAAVPMATAAADALQARGLRVRDGLVIPAQPTMLHHPVLRVVPGDHPIPGEGSREAAREVGRFARQGRPGDLVLVLLSGGTSSLIAAPVDHLDADDLVALHQVLIRSGQPVGLVNRLRRRCSRWGAGRLALALAPARIELLAISDVPGDVLADIGSGPCSPDPDRALALRDFLQSASLWTELPAGVRRLLDETVLGTIADTPARGDPRLEGVGTRIIARNRDAVLGAMRAATGAGLVAEAAAEVLAGEAAPMGRRIAEQLLAPPATGTARCVVWGGETVVRLEPEHQGLGGRSQELALAAASVLGRSQGDFPALLAAGTDGRDGPTPAAGGFAMPGTWRRIRAAGRDPAADLAAHDSHRALAAADATLVTGPTGTNVMDLVIGLSRPDPKLKE
jgi:hydroxypyruvate reductase